MSKGLTITNIEIIVDLGLSAPNGEEWVVTKAWETDVFYYIEFRQVTQPPLENLVILSKYASTITENEPKEFRRYTLQGLNKSIELTADFISDKNKLLKAISIVTFES